MTDYYSQDGDSGGPVWASTKALGVHSGACCGGKVFSPLGGAGGIEARLGVKVLTSTPADPARKWLLKNSNTGGSHDISWSYGDASGVPVVGDWIGDWHGMFGWGEAYPVEDLRDRPGQFSGSSATWYMEGIPTPGWYGIGGDKPVPGDWDGDGIDERGVFRPGTGMWYLDSVPAGPYGTVGDIPLAGDFNGDGSDYIAIYRQSEGRFFIPDVGSFWYGIPGDFPVVGDWNGDGIDTVGVVRAGQWFLSNSFGGPANYVFTYGSTTDLPITGDWDGDGTDTPGIVKG